MDEIKTETIETVVPEVEAAPEEPSTIVTDVEVTPAESAELGVE